MNKDHYLKLLKRYLGHINNDEKQDILNEYETHFYSGKQEGKSEEQISQELGNPKSIAKELRATAAVERAKSNSSISNIFSAIIAVMGLSLFNFFIILFPAVMIFFAIVSLILFTISMLGAPIMLIVKGFIDGYNTLDALASLAFGIIIVTTIKKLGVTHPNIIAKETFKSGTISIVGMGLIYSLLAIMGTMSLGNFKVSENGGIALAQIAQHYLGDYGIIVLSLIIVVACLKTAIGLITAFSETFTELFPKQKYIMFATVVSVLACIFANVGLTKIIMYSTPVLMFIYPLAITLILLTLASPLFNHSKIVYRFTTFFTMIAAFIDGVKASPEFFVKTSFARFIISLGEKYLPFFTIGMGWIIPALIGFIIGLIVFKVRGSKQPQS